MAFCYKCGSPINSDSNFCEECGATNLSLKANQSESSNGERIQEFVGKISKCPNCGEVLKALVAKCPSCGLELQEVGNSSSVKAFTDKLSDTVSRKERIDLIKSFPIPNAKADIFDFLVLATSNFDTQKHLSATGSEKEMSEAWLCKIEQAYVKAEALFKNDSDFAKFQELYDSDIKELQEAEANKAIGKHYFLGTIMIAMAAFVFSIIVLLGSSLLANPRLCVSALLFFANGIISYIYARRRDFKLITLIAYSVNAIVNVLFCLVAPGHLFHVLIIVACGLGAFIDKKS